MYFAECLNFFSVYFLKKKVFGPSMMHIVFILKSNDLNDLSENDQTTVR